MRTRSHHAPLGSGTEGLGTAGAGIRPEGAIRIVLNALRVLPGGVTVYRNEIARGLHTDRRVILLVACRLEDAPEFNALGIQGGSNLIK